MAFVLIPKVMEVLYETLIKIQLTFVKNKEPETLLALELLAVYWPHGQGEPSTQTKSNTLNVRLTYRELIAP